MNTITVSAPLLVGSKGEISMKINIFFKHQQSLTHIFYKGQQFIYERYPALKEAYDSYLIKNDSE